MPDISSRTSLSGKKLVKGPRQTSPQASRKKKKRRISKITSCWNTDMWKATASFFLPKLIIIKIPTYPFLYSNHVFSDISMAVPSVCHHHHLLKRRKRNKKASWHEKDLDYNTLWRLCDINYFIEDDELRNVGTKRRRRKRNGQLFSPPSHQKNPRRYVFVIIWSSPPSQGIRKCNNNNIKSYMNAKPNDTLKKQLKARWRKKRYGEKYSAPKLN